MSSSDSLISSDLLAVLDVDLDSFCIPNDSTDEDCVVSSSSSSFLQLSQQRLSLLESRFTDLSSFDSSLSPEVPSLYFTSSHSLPLKMVQRTSSTGELSVEESFSMSQFDYDCHFDLYSAVSPSLKLDDMLVNDGLSDLSNVDVTNDVSGQGSHLSQSNSGDIAPGSTIKDQSVNPEMERSEEKHKSFFDSLFSTLQTNFKKNKEEKEKVESKKKSKNDKKIGKLTKLFEKRIKLERKLLQSFDFDCYDELFDTFLSYCYDNSFVDSFSFTMDENSDESLNLSDYPQVSTPNLETNSNLCNISKISSQSLVLDSLPKSVDNRYVKSWKLAPFNFKYLNIGFGNDLSFESNSSNSIVSRTKQDLHRHSVLNFKNLNSIENLSFEQIGFKILTEVFWKNWTKKIFSEFSNFLHSAHHLRPRYLCDFSLKGCSDFEFLKHINGALFVDTIVDLSMNKLTEDSVFPTLTQFLNLSYNSIRSSPILFQSHLNFIKFLNLSHNNVTDLLFLKNLPFLKFLNVSNNHFPTFDFELPPRLQCLISSHCQIMNFSTPSHILKVLDISFNSFTKVDLSCLSGLENLNISNCANISSLGAQNFPMSFKYLKAANCSLVECILSPCFNLEFINLRHNQISKLEVSNFNLEHFDISFNNLNCSSLFKLFSVEYPSLKALFFNDNADQIDSSSISPQYFPILQELNSFEFTSPQTRVSNSILQFHKVKHFSNIEQFSISKSHLVTERIKKHCAGQKILMYWTSFKLSNKFKIIKKQQCFECWQNRFKNQKDQNLLNYSATLLSSVIRGFLVRRRLSNCPVNDSSSELSDCTSISDLDDVSDFDLDSLDCDSAFLQLRSTVKNSENQLTMPETVQMEENNSDQYLSESDVELEEHSTIIENSSPQLSPTNSDCKANDVLYRRRLRFQKVKLKSKLNSLDSVTRLRMFHKRANIPESFRNVEKLSNSQSTHRLWSSESPQLSPKISKFKRKKFSAPAYLGGEAQSTSRSRDRIRLPSIQLKQAWIEPPP
ncbi:hypothetical protein GEMRC1_014101 [Eukaryota sp. GEM-RC1]